MLKRLCLSLVPCFAVAAAAHADVPPQPGPAPSPDAGKIDGGGAAPDPAGDKAPTGEEAPSEAEQLAAFKKALGAIEGPSQGAKLGDVATIDVPAGYWLVPQEGTALLDKTVENIHDPKSVGALVKGDLDTVLYFTFDPIGYVKDDERDLDAAELLQSMREGTAQENLTRKASGFAQIEITGWMKEPFYNDKTQSLEWATSFREVGSQGTGTSNYNTRRLGRDGVMSVVLACDPAVMQAEVEAMNKNLGSFLYVPGRDYGSYKEGDRMAEIGLGALVVGGAGVALAKVGFFKKFWKLLVAGGAIVLGGIAKLFGGGKKKAAAEESVIKSDES